MTQPTDRTLDEAVEALRQGENARAKDILTRLIKADPNNPTYWIWMSGAVDTLKERVYCLEAALKIDPANGVAKRGLMLMGALPADPNVKPFPMNRQRAWEDKLFLEHERPRETGLRAVMSSPAARLAGILVTGAVVVTLVVLGFFNPRTAVFREGKFVTPGPSPTFSATPTYINAAGPGAPTPGKPTPLAILLGISYTPTPVYVNTPRVPASVDIFRAAQAAFQQGNWDEYLRQMEQLQKVEPAAADVPYYIGEGYRLMKGDCSQALFYYNESLKVDRGFSPGYLGLARARLCMEPGTDVTQLYDAAIEADPAYGEIYLDRANFYLARKDPKKALADLGQAARLMPSSALVQLAYAQAYLQQGSYASALSAARKANSIDLTLVPSYYYLGRSLIANGNYADAIKPLQTYVTYENRDGGAYALLGQALAETQDYRSAIQALNSGLRLDPNQVQSFVYLGTAYLRTDNLAGAEVNFKRTLSYFPDSFDANIGLTEIYYKKGTYGTAYLQSETAMSKAETDTERALAIYWRALCQEGRQKFSEAIKDWKTLLSMPVSAMTPQMRQDAQDHLRNIVLPTGTPKPAGPSPTPSITPTNRPGSTATPPKLPTSTPTP